jgi:hypothetical protein
MANAPSDAITALGDVFAVVVLTYCQTIRPGGRGIRNIPLQVYWHGKRVSKNGSLTV